MIMVLVILKSSRCHLLDLLLISRSGVVHSKISWERGQILQHAPVIDQCVHEQETLPFQFLGYGDLPCITA
ncbi:MAG: hypothetical protein COY47_01580, partial [Chloroflexi bacterium CG_4_10_14_0_8_um_filter_57_5]